ncbi:MAG TPA: ABC transporter permease [Blastocatellia bacterium]|nr:ABC transporter permease [Blastocatellia bacterium]
METLLKDIRYGLRMLVKNPGFTAVAVVSLALGIGANTAIFSIINSFLLAPLPVTEPARLVSVFTTDQKNPGPLPVSHYNFLDYRDKTDVWDGILAYNFAAVNLNRSTGEGRQLFAEVVTGNYFDVLGVKPLYGRAFLPDEDRTLGTHPVAVLSYASWQRDFGGDPAIVNQTISLNRRDFTVVGITPKDFTGTNLGGAPDLYIPMMMHREVQPDLAMFYDARRGLAFNLIGRLKPGVSLQQAQAAMSTLASELERQYPQDNEGRNVRLVPLLQARLDPQGDGQTVETSLILMSIVGIVLLIACANVANLLLARATRRRREIAIRVAIGATRLRLVRQLLTESVVLSLIGGAVGLLAAFWTKDVIGSLVPFGGGPNAAEIRLDEGVILFTLVITLVSGLIFGLAPALQASRADLVPTLKGDVTVPVGQRGFRLNLRKALVILQVALSLFALITAGLFVRSLQKARAVSPGFITENVVLMGLNFGREGYTQEQALQFHRQLLERVQSVPGVQSATIARDRPVSFGLLRSVFLEGQEPAPGGRGVLVQTNDIGPRYFETLGISVVRGRDFAETDGEKAPQVVIINEVMAKRFWPEQDALGKRFKFFGDPEYRQVVGIARDVKVTSLTERPRPLVYLPVRQDYPPQVTLHVRAAGDVTALVGSLRGAIQALDPNLSVLNVETMSDRVNESLQGERTQATLLGSAGVIALLLASVGLYGVMSYTVAQRTREIGIRMALGASRRNVMGLVLKQGAALVGVGVIIGLGAAFGLTRLVASSLFGVTAVDPLTFAGTSLLLMLVSLAASYLPARRATKVDPIIALRYE